MKTALLFILALDAGPQGVLMVLLMEFRGHFDRLLTFFKINLGRLEYIMQLFIKLFLRLRYFCCDN